MDQRINYGKLAPKGIRALDGLETYLRSSGLEPGLLDLSNTRASQLNGCAYCLDSIRRTPARAARPSSGSTPCQRGARLRSTPTGNEPCSPGAMR
jgi:hypothetical protein